MQNRFPGIERSRAASLEHQRQAALGVRPTPDKGVLNRQAAQTFASELLPPILGGPWQYFDSGADVEPRPGTLFDHGMLFRRPRTRPHTWDGLVVIGQPYELLDPSWPTRPDVLAEVARLHQARVGVWISAELSTHFPGRTWLTLAARGLVAAEAPSFGFIAL